MESGRHNSFTAGCLNFRHSAITDHIKTADHKFSRQAPDSRDNNERVAEKQDATEDIAGKLALKVVYWMVTEDLPLSKFPSLIQLMKDLHVPNIDKLQVSEKVKYDSYTSAVGFLQALSSSADEDLKSKLKASSAVTVLADESTDITTTKKLVLYATIADSSLQPSTHFVANVHCPDGTGAGLANSILNVMGKFGVPAKKIMGLGSDGASVMTGRGKGTTGMLLRENPHLVNVHCMAHRLALCTSQAADAVPGMKLYHETVTSLYYYFKLSATRVARFKEIQRILDNQELKIKEVHGVRWLSFFEALDVVFRSLDSLLTFFQESSDAKAVGLRKKIGSTKFISITYLLMDIIPIVTKLSQFLQKQNLDVAQVQVKLADTVHDLELLKDATKAMGQYQKELKKDLQAAPLDSESLPWKTGWQFKGHEVTGCPADHITSIQTDFLDALISNIKKRFPDSEFMSAFGILAMRPISVMPEEQLAEWGDQKLETLLDHYGKEKSHSWTDSNGVTQTTISEPQLDADVCRQEWRRAKTTVLLQDYPRVNILDLWTMMAKHHAEEFPNLIKLAALAVTCPLQTADCERGFSAQNRILTALRNRLSPETQNMLLSVKLGHVDIERAYRIWKSEKPRKLLAKK